MRLKRRKQVLFYLLLFAIPCIVLGMPLALYEVILRYQPAPPSRDYAKPLNGSFQEQHPKMGVQLKAGGVYDVEFTFPEEAPYIARYTLDADRKRHTPVADPNPRDRFIAVFGCSMMFGTAANDNETVPYYLGEQFPAYHPYNYGEPGCAVPHMLHRLESGKLDLKEEKGIGVYVYYYFHMSRMIFTQREDKAYQLPRPAYRYEANGLHYEGTLREAHPWRAWWYDLSWHSRVYRKHISSIPLYTTHDAHTVGALIVESARQFNLQYPDSEFVLALWQIPGTGIGWRLPDVRDFVARHGIRTVDLCDAAVVDQLDQWEWFADGHMKPATAARFAQNLGHKLGL